MSFLFVVALTLCYVVACGSKPVLLPRNGVNVGNIDLSGNWVLRRESGSPVAGSVADDHEQIIPTRTSRRSKRSRSKESAVHVFLESGTSLKVTQTLHGLFISFDRAIVEEFTFGENRLVSIGPIEAQRVSGWEGDAFIAETMGEKGAVLTERWSLEEDGAVLVRKLSLVERGELTLSREQVFDRQ